MFTVTTIREQAGKAGRVVTAIRRQPSWVARAALTAAALAMAAVVLLLVIPAVVLFVIVFAIGAAVARVGSFFRRQHAPNGMLDGRRNVRVVTRDQDSVV